MEGRLNTTEMPEMSNEEGKLNVLGDSTTSVSLTKRKGRGAAPLNKTTWMEGQTRCAY